LNIDYHQRGCHSSPRTNNSQNNATCTAEID
jgi:hypothetical protein